MEELIWWIDPWSGNEYPIIKTLDVDTSAGSFSGRFTDGVVGVFYLRDCRTA